MWTHLGFSTEAVGGMNIGKMLSEWSALPAGVSERDKYCMTSLICGIQKVKQTSDYHQKKQTHRYREQTSGYQWGETGEGQLGIGELRGANYYVENKLQG